MFRKKAIAGMVAGVFVIGALSAPAVHAATVTHKNGTSVAVTVTTSNANKTISVKDNLGDSRWVQAQYLRGSTGNTVYYLSNKSGVGTTVSANTTTAISSIKACFSGTALAGMHCSDWKAA